jgi:acyl-coenzyme A thioesterase 13
MRSDILNLLRANLGVTLENHTVGLTKWLNARVDAVSDEGLVRLSFAVRDDMLNALGMMHGGAVAAIMDEAMGLQLFLLNAEANYVAISLHVDFLSKAMPGQSVVAVPQVTRMGRNVAHVTGELFDENGKLLAKSSGHFARFGQ